VGVPAPGLTAPLSAVIEIAGGCGRDRRDRHATGRQGRLSFDATVGLDGTEHAAEDLAPAGLRAMASAHCPGAVTVGGAKGG